jgi:hypothetical protein
MVEPVGEHAIADGVSDRMSGKSQIKRGFHKAYEPRGRVLKRRAFKAGGKVL